MRIAIHVGLLASLLGVTACGAPDNQTPSQAPVPAGQQPAAQQPAPPGNALTTPAPAGGTAGVPASTPGADTRAPAGAPSEPGASGAPSASAGSSSSAKSLSPGAAASSAPAAPYLMLMEVPSGTELRLILETPVSSATAKVEQEVRARLANPVVVSGMTVLAEGTPFTGNVVAVERAGKVKGRSSLAIRFNSVTVANKAYKISTSRIVRVGEATKSEDATKIGIGAGAGAIIGGIAGGKKGAAIGAGVGGGAGTGVVLATRGKDVSIPEGAAIRTTVQEAVRVNAPM